ncbi:unnamed protein product, partial [Mesorhabditis spiculigera]
MLPEPPIFKETYVVGVGEVEFLDGPTEKLWKQWNDQIAIEAWSGDDVSMRTLTPILPTTRCVFARRKDTGDYLGAVTWNEYDGYTFIGGVGRVLWDRATDRWPAGQPHILRAVAEMEPYYRRRNGMIGEQNLIMYMDHWRKFCDYLEPEAFYYLDTTLVSELNPKQFQKLLDFDKYMTGRDRSEFLRLHFGLEKTEGAVVFGDDGNIWGMASVGPTDRPDDHRWKISPIYAETLPAAASLAIRMEKNWAGSQDDHAHVLVQILDLTRGDFELGPVLAKHVKPHKVGVTLYNRNYYNPIRLHNLYVPHNNSGHFDA